MLDMDIVHGKPALKVDFELSLAADLIDTTSMILSAPWLEGLDQWIYATHAALPPDLKDDLELTLFLMGKGESLYTRIFQLPFDHPVHRDFAAYTAWLDTLTEDFFYEMIRQTLAILAQVCEEEETPPLAESAPPPSLDDPEALRACLRVKLDEKQVDRAIQLIQNPQDLKARFIATLTRFWDQFYLEETQRCRPLMERSVAYHRLQSYSGDFHTILLAVAGRRLSREYGDFEHIERVVFVPSCHVGPYVLLHDFEELHPTLYVHFNCRPTGAPQREQTPSIQDLFPPLKALADETRLQIISMLDGRELYAQEIVERLDISQSAVSRHLKLMVTGGLLTVRKEDGMKYLSLNQEILATLAERLKSFRGVR